MFVVERRFIVGYFVQDDIVPVGARLYDHIVADDALHLRTSEYMPDRPSWIPGLCTITCKGY
jgi:hypothetical protein